MPLHDDSAVANVVCSWEELEHESSDIGTPDDDCHRAADIIHVKVDLIDTPTVTYTMNVGL